jgi:tripartite ATP-independent transporter DctP family solute receptor
MLFARGIRELLFAAGAVLACAVPAAASAAPLELKAGSSLPANDQATLSLKKFAEIVAAKSGGEIVVNVFPQSLGVEHQLVQGAQGGSLDVGMITNGNASRFTNAYLVLDLPFLFKRYDDLLDYMNTPGGRESVGRFEKDSGLKHLYMIGFGSGRDIQTRTKALRTPADIKGLKIRTISTPVELATFRAWGANPTPLGWDQTYTALQQGVVDGMQSNLAPVWAGKFNEVIKHNIRLNYTASFEEVFISQKRFDSLAPRQQQVLMEAAKETEAWIRKYSSEQLDKYIADLKKSGVEMYEPSPAEYAQWASVREKVWEEAAAAQPGKIDLGLARRIHAAQK